MIVAYFTAKKNSWTKDKVKIASETVRNPGFMTSEPENLPEHPEMFIPRTSSVTRLDALQPRDMVVDVVLQV